MLKSIFINNIFLIGVTTFLLLISGVLYKVFKIKKFIKKFQQKGQYDEKLDLKIRFSKENLEKFGSKNIDYIIIGSGLTGLTTAVLLSKLGKKVVVLEQHGKPGGCLHTFKKNDFHFDTGFHYIGNDKPFLSMLKLITSKDIEFNIMMHYDKIVFDDDQFDYVAPTSTFMKNLKEKFPEQEKQIDLYKKLLFKARKVIVLHYINCLIIPSIFRGIFQFFLSIFYGDLYKKSTQEVLEKIGIKDGSQLFAVINGIYGDLGAKPKDQPFVLHSGLMSHYMKNGSMYPKKGVRSIVQSVVSSLKHFGGELYTKASVQKFIIENNKCVGVVLKGGAEIRAKKVISTMGASNTIQALPEPKRWKLPYSEDQFSNFSLFIGIDDENLKLPSHNVWYLPFSEEYGYDIEKVHQDYYNGNRDKGLLFCSFPNSKHQFKDSKKQVIQLISEAKNEWVAPYKINETQRKEGYIQYKTEVQNAMLKTFYKLFPQCKDKEISYLSMATPLTNEKFLGRQSTYGLEVTTKRFFDYNHFMQFNTTVNNLFISGEDICFPSVTNTVFVGILTVFKCENIL